MIEFDCPKCGALNVVSDRKAGSRMRCSKCDERIRVPGEPPRQKVSDFGEPRRPRDRLSKEEYILYGVAFLVFPVVNVVISSILYYTWRETLPTKAFQINQLGWVIFGIQFLPMCCCCCLGAIFGPHEQHRPRRR